MRAVAGAGRAPRHDPADSEALDGLAAAVEEMGAILRFYEQVPTEQGIRRR